MNEENDSTTISDLQATKLKQLDTRRKQNWFARYG